MLFTNYDYFLKVVETGSISKAAEALYISQPSLTKYIARLENIVGDKLFDRNQHPLKLTASGSYFYEYVLKMQSEEQNLQTKVHEIKFEGRDEISIGMNLWRSNVLLPEFLPGFLQKYPLITVHLVEGGSSKLEDEIENDAVDFCILNLPVNHANLSYEILAEEYIFLAGSYNNPFVIEQKKKALLRGRYYHVNIHDFADQKFILTFPGQHITSYVNDMLSKEKIELNVLLRTANVSTAINLAAAGMGFTFVPEIGTKTSYFPGKGIELFTISEPSLTCSLAVVYKKDKYLSQACRIFIDEFKKFINDSNH